MTRLYLAYFKRRPDPEGLAYWMGRAAQGRDPPPGLAVVRSVSRVQRHLRTTRRRGLCHARLSERPWSRPRPAGIHGLGRTAQWRTPRPRRSDGRLLRVKRVPVERWRGGPHGTRHANDSVHLSNARRSSNRHRDAQREQETFIIHTLDSHLQITNFLVNEIGPYTGTTYLPDDGADRASYLEIDADGTWRIEIRDVCRPRRRSGQRAPPGGG